MIYKVDNFVPNTEKAKSLIRMFNQGLNIPLTIILGMKEDIPQVLKILDLYEQYNYVYYVRFNFSDNEYPHHVSFFSSTILIEEKLNNYFEIMKVHKRESFDVIIQPMLTTDCSGGLIVKGEFLFVEVVHGNPRALFRNGFFHKRVLFASNGQEISSTRGDQPFSLFFDVNDCKLKKNTFREINYPFSKIVDVQNKLQNNCLYEFTFSKNQLIFLQEKKDFNDAYIQIEKGNIQPPFCVFYNPVKSGEAVFYDYPGFEFIDECKKSNAVVIRNGAYLSHLSSYLCENRIHCEFLS